MLGVTIIQITLKKYSMVQIVQKYFLLGRKTEKSSQQNIELVVEIYAPCSATCIAVHRREKKRRN